MQNYLARTKKKRDLEQAKLVLKKSHADLVKAKAAEAEKSKTSEGASASLPQPGPVITGGQKAGCARCDYAEVGCLSCCGWKAARYFRKQEYQDLLADASQAKDAECQPPAEADEKEKNAAPQPKPEPKPKMLMVIKKEPEGEDVS